MPVADWLALERTDALLVDVRNADEFAAGHVPGAINIPLPELRRRHDELPRDRRSPSVAASGSAPTMRRAFSRNVATAPRIFRAGTRRIAR